MKDLEFKGIEDPKVELNFKILRDEITRIEDEYLKRVHEPIYWDDQQVVPSSVRLPAANAPTWAGYKGSQILVFSASATNRIYFSAQLSHAYQEGADIDFHIHIIHGNNLTLNSVWVFGYSWANVGDVFPSQTTVSLTNAAPGVTDKHQYVDFGSISGAGKKISSILLCELYRDGTDAGDTFPNNIGLVGLDFHIKKNSIGSLQETVKGI